MNARPSQIDFDPSTWIDPEHPEMHPVPGWLLDDGYAPNIPENAWFQRLTVAMWALRPDPDDFSWFGGRLAIERARDLYAPQHLERPGYLTVAAILAELGALLDG